MSTRYKKILFITLWLLILSLAPYTVLNNLNQYLLKTRPLLITASALQRSMGLLAFTMLSLQIVIGSNMQRIAQKLGSWIYKFHLTQGVIIYSLIVLHTLMLFWFNYMGTGKINPFYIYSDFCLICKSRIELYYTLGRISFWLIAFTVLAAKFRTLPWLRRYWRYIHIANYIIFTLIALHAGVSGGDILLKPFVYVYWLGVGAVIFTIVKRSFYVLKEMKVK